MDLRISVTDRCNFRCTYCMPKEAFGPGFDFLARGELLTYEEIARLAKAFVAAGVAKIRLTGGEPLLRRDLERLIAMLASIEGLHDLALTTNGSLLTPDKARALRAAGLHRVTVSLDALDDAVFRRMNDVDFPVARVLAGVDAAASAGLSPVKIDVVVRRGINDAEIVPLARHFRGSGHVVRFIEYMDVGTKNGWLPREVVPGAEVLRRIDAAWPLVPTEPSVFGEVAQRFRYADGQGEVGIITSVTQPFCGTCTRARIAANGEFYLCLFAGSAHNLRDLVRSAIPDDALTAAITAIWQGRSDRYSEIRAASPRDQKVEMSHIGG